MTIPAPGILPTCSLRYTIESMKLAKDLAADSISFPRPAMLLSSDNEVNAPIKLTPIISEALLVDTLNLSN